MSYSGFKHSQETKDLISKKIKAFYEGNPDAAIVSGKKMRAAAQRFRTVECVWCWEPFESYLGRRRACEGCSPIDRWDARLRKAYGVGFHWYQETFFAQGGRCAICRQEQGRSRYSLSVDHCHGTNEVRGLLCESCNLVLGKMQDSPKLLRMAAAYLETYRTTATTEGITQ